MPFVCTYSRRQTRMLSWKIAGDYRGANIFHSLKAVLFSPQGRIEKQAALDKTVRSASIETAFHGFNVEMR